MSTELVVIDPARLLALVEDVAQLKARVAALEAGQRPVPRLETAAEPRIGAERILALIEITHNPADQCTSSEIAAHLTAHGVNLGTCLHGQRMIIAAILHNAGIAKTVRRRITGQPGAPRIWVGVKVVTPAF